MKLRTSFLTRCLAMVLAVLMVVSAVNLGAVLQVSASETTVTAGEIVANNYDLTDAEKDLLSSGLLAGESITYTAPSNGDALITVDTENAKISAKTEGEWVPVSASIIKNGAVVENVTLANGEGKYNPSVGNAFSVKVEYTLYGELDVETHTNLLLTAGWLKDDLAALKAAYAADVNLGTLTMAMDTLVDLANGISMNFGTTSITAQFGAEAIAAVKALSAETKANNGQLDLQVMNAAYNASASKTQYLLENGAAYKETLDETTAAVKAIVSDPLTNNSILDSYLQSSEPAGYTQWMAFKKIMNNLVATMEPVAGTDWIAASRGTSLVAKNVNYLELDAKVAALGEITVVGGLVSPLVVASVDVQKNLSMFNVTVKVVLNTVADEADSAELVKAEAEPVVLTLAAGASAEQVIAEAKDVVEAALAAWEAYAEGHYDVVASELPGALNADIDYVVTYSPKSYSVTYAYATDAPASVPYGYQMTLPAHEDPAQAYDYTVNGEAYAQGEIVVIEGATEISRSAGKAYTVTDLYSIIADNYGNDVAKAILKSGALVGNEIVNVRKPDPADAENLLKLYDGELTANPYSAAYNGLYWNANTYGENGTENNFSGSIASWNGKSVKVQYKLTLSNYTEAQVAEILELVADLKAGADAQTATLNSFAANTDAMGQLDKTKLGALNGVIDVTDFTPGDGTETDEASVEMQKYFKGLVSGIIANNLDSNNYLKIYNMLGNYNNEGLRYYYANSAAVIAEIDSLAGYLSGMLADDDKIAALKIMVDAAGFPEYADKIVDLEEQLNSVKESLTAPNAAIDLESPNMGALIAALTAEGEVVTTKAGSPYLLSEVLMATDSSQVYVQVIIDAGKAGSATVVTEAMDRNTVLSQEVVNGLKNAVSEKVDELLGENVKYYNLSASASLDALVGKELSSIENIYYTYSAKEYKATIIGENPQIVTIEDLEIDLPKHETAGWEYRYTIDGVEGITTSTYTFTAEQLDRLFTNGLYGITRTAVNEAAEKLETTFEDWIVEDAEGTITGLYAKVDGNKDGVMGFAMKIVESGYTYIGLNGEPLLYMNEEDTLEIKLQTLINALLADNQFSSDTLINLGKNGKGEFVHAAMQLGNSADDIQFEDLDFVLYMNSVPSQMGTVSNGLAKIKPYMTFNSNNGVMDVNINLPEKVYEVYLAAMLATGNIDKDNMEAINSEIAFQFLWDYVDLIMATDANTVTYTNTLAKLGQDYDLTGYEDYYQLAKKALTNPGVVVNPETNGEFDMSVTAKSQKAIDALISFAGIDISGYETYLGMIYEYKYEDAQITGAARANLVNSDKDFEAALIDLNASGVTNKFDFTNDLPARAKTIADKAAVILLDTVDGDLVFNGTTILDLNGQTVNGNIVSNGSLYIVDSALDTDESGKVNGNVSGNVVIIAGSYAGDVSKYLKDGYKQVNGAVQNALYTIESDGKNVCFVINTNVMSDESVENYIPNVRALAVDIAVDLALNYYTAAALSADGNALYHVNIDDLIGLITSSNKVDDLIVKVLNCVDVPGMSDFVNVVVADLLDFGALASALESGEPVATYNLTTAPWAVTVEHKTEEDYITFGIGTNPSLAKAFSVSLKLEGSNKDRVLPLLKELANVVDASAEVHLTQPIYDGANNALSITGTAEASAYLTLNEDSDYAVIIAVILANGNPDQKDALIAAVNAGDMDALKDVIDEMTVEDIFTALKVLNRNEKFAAIASKVGVTVDVNEAAKLENLYHLILCAGGKVLEELDITGFDKKLGNLDRDDDGIYEFTADATRKPDASYRGYSVYTEASVAVSLTVNLFGQPDCLWGDANHDGEVDATDASLILQYYVGNAPANFCTIRTDVNGDGDIDGTDASLVLQYYVGAITKFPVEN